MIVLKRGDKLIDKPRKVDLWVLAAEEYFAICVGWVDDDDYCRRLPLCYWVDLPEGNQKTGYITKLGSWENATVEIMTSGNPIETAIKKRGSAYDAVCTSVSANLWVFPDDWFNRIYLENNLVPEGSENL